jgi:SAM-dependent methyltransferase
VDFHEIAERDHDLQNPTSADKIRLLGSYVRLGSDTRVLDVACGKGGPAIVLASTFGCRVVGVELRRPFVDAARERIAERGLESLIEVHEADASGFPLEATSWNAAFCLGASFVWGTIGDAAASLSPAVIAGGFVAVGEPFWREWPLPDGIDDEGFVDLAATVERFTSTGLTLTGLIAADRDDWDRYESLHWRALDEWLAAHAKDAGADEVRSTHERARRKYIAYRRDLLGWAIFVGRRPG